MTRKTSEHDEQVKLFTWARIMAVKEPEKYCMLEHMFAVPNGGLRDKITGARLKAAGVKKGVPDIFLLHRRLKYNGLVIEMKSEKGKLSKEQALFLSIFSANKFATAICYSFEEARDDIEKYLKS